MDRQTFLEHTAKAGFLNGMEGKRDRDLYFFCDIFNLLTLLSFDLVLAYDASQLHRQIYQVLRA